MLLAAGGDRTPFNTNRRTNRKPIPSDLHLSPCKTDLRFVRLGDRLRLVSDSCQSLSQFRIGQLGNPLKISLYDPLEAGDPSASLR